MSKRRPRRRAFPAKAPPPVPAFAPVPVRARHDGWTPARQVEFVEALAEAGCVADACRRVGMSTESAYRLRRRIEARDFRLAWDAALDYAIRRLSDAALSRAINGVAVPHFYKGEIVGEHRRYDEALTRFLLRYRDPLRYAKTNDVVVFEGHDEMFAVKLAETIHDVRHEAMRNGFLEFERAAEEAEAEAAAAEAAIQAKIAAADATRAERDVARFAAAQATLTAYFAEKDDPSAADVALPSSTSERWTRDAAAPGDAGEPLKPPGQQPRISW